MTKNKLTPCSGSFRDNCGQVYISTNNEVYRTISQRYAQNYNLAKESGFFESAISKNLLLPFTEVEPVLDSYKTITSPYLPFISYPYEWCFGQLKDAALHTLDILDLAISNDLVLKDATAYNIQFQGAVPTFIDHLSFNIKDAQKPWVAYLQFCKHFLAPLALQAKVDVSLNKLLSTWIDGIPLDVTTKLLPFKSKLSPLLAIHIYLHAKYIKKYENKENVSQKINKIELPKNAIKNLSQSLRSTINSLNLPKSMTSEWGDYYSNTNYSNSASDDKFAYLEKVAKKYSSLSDTAIDIGANEGVYSYFLSNYFNHVIAADVDYIAIEKLYQRLKKEGNKKITPIVLDLTNPTPAIGFANNERQSLTQRVSASYLNALALIHHLVITFGIPLNMISSYFASLIKVGGICVLEFVSSEDSQVIKMCSTKNIADLPEYSKQACIKAFEANFNLLEEHKIKNSHRTIFIFEKKEN